MQALRREVFTLYVAFRHPRVPWYAKALAIAVVGYALSPVDLIPDFIPLLGYLDDLVLIPLGVWLVVRLIPPEVLAQCRRDAESLAGRVIRAGRVAAVVILLFWLLTAVLILRLLLRASG